MRQTVPIGTGLLILLPLAGPGPAAYKSGVGYFEHLGRVRGNQSVTIDLTSGQLDDVLKSLTTVDLGDGRVTGITFNSTASIEQRLRSSTLPLDAMASRGLARGAAWRPHRGAGARRGADLRAAR